MIAAAWLRLLKAITGVVALAAVATSGAAGAGGPDFNGDGKDEVAVYRPSTGYWYVKGATPTQLGQPGDLPAAADYDGDGRTELVVFRPSNARWYAVGGASFAAYGLDGDVPVPADYTGDRKADVSVYRASTGRWYVQGSGSTVLGASGDKPVPADYDGDCRTDMAVFRPSNGNWYATSGSFAAFGISGDLPTPADYDGDGKDDVSVFRPSTGVWYIKGFAPRAIGQAGDVPVPGDYDGDGKDELAVFRPSNGTWYSLAGSFAAFGMDGDVPVRTARAKTACGGGSDTVSPTGPTDLTVTGATQTSLAVTWTGSTDNVGVTGYGLYRDGALLGSTSVTSHTFGGLTCGTSYVLAVDAADAAGNRSGKATTAASTSTCTPTGGASWFLSTTGSDQSACTSAVAPCKTFDGVYRKARPGEVVEVAGGTYPGQTLGLDTSKTSPNDVLFRPAAGATVTLSGPLTVDGRHFEIRDMTLRYQIRETAQDVTFRNVLARGAIWIRSDGTQAPADISVIGGEIGPGVDTYPAVATNGFSTTAVPRNILFEGVYFHDWTRSSGSDNNHIECIQIWGADGLTIRNSRFRNCWVFDIYIEKLVGGAAPTPTNVVIENNFLECCAYQDNYAIRLSDTASDAHWRNITIRNNSSDMAFNLGAGAAYTNVRVLSNIAPRFDGPVSGVIVDYNVWYAGRAIGAHDRVAPHGYVDAAGANFHLAAGAAAIDRGDPATAPADDIDGDARPVGPAPDAGADERR